MIRRILPSIQLHCWGGLGSQLYAWALRLDLEERFPHRRFVLVTHESGVSQRASELAPFFPDSVKCVQDFKVNSQKQVHLEAKQKNNDKSRLRVKLKSLFDQLGFVLNGDKPNEANRIKPWTFQIRGHFSLLSVKPHYIDEIHSKILDFVDVEKIASFKNKTLIHYRLGDLLTLNDKGPVPPNRVIETIKQLERAEESKLFLFSDSSDIALDWLCQSSIPLLPVNDFSAVESLMALAESEVLVCTNSKLSVWASLFRARKESSNLTYVPIEIEHHLHSNYPQLTNIVYY